MRSKALLISLLVGVLVALSNPAAVSSQFLPCNIVTLAISGPPSVEVGQTLQITTTVTGSCDASMFYAIRVDLVDAHSNQVLSKVIFPYAPVTAGFSIPITNNATAPTVVGTWVLQINAYLIATVNGAVVTSSHQLFTVDVVPYVTPTTTEQMTTNSTTLSEIPTTSQLTSTSEIASTTSTSTSYAEAQGNTYPTSTLVAAGAIIAILAVIILILLNRKRTATSRLQPTQTDNMKYCGHCGSKLGMADEFCGHCGTKQT